MFFNNVAGVRSHAAWNIIEELDNESADSTDGGNAPVERDVRKDSADLRNVILTLSSNLRSLIARLSDNKHDGERVAAD
jgi:hypothetical protein